jgi:Reversibly glycosylated polypeptide
LAPPPRKNVRYFDFAQQRAFMGEHYPAIPHKSAACRNFGHYLAYKEGFDIIVALDYDCRTRAGWLEAHVAELTTVQDAPALQGRWINSVEQPGFFARGYPYEFRNAEAGVVKETHASGEVKLNMGVWDNVLDLNGIDKLQKEPPATPGLRGDRNYAALGMVPLCGMNTAFRAELTPAYFFLPDFWVEGWQVSRHDDIWGGYILEKLMAKRGDLVTFGRPVVEHTRQSNMNRVIMLEHYMHLMAKDFYAVVDAALEPVRPGTYTDMFAHFAGEYCAGVERAAVPAHYRQGFRDLGESMMRWANAFK